MYILPGSSKDVGGSYHRRRTHYSSAIHALAKGKCLGLDGLMVDFFKAYYNFTSVDFTTMVNESLECGCFPKGVTSGLNSLWFKQGKRWRLTNWQSTIAL
jgi:hypothetical protein